MNRLFICSHGPYFSCDCIIGIAVKETDDVAGGTPRYECKCLLHGTYHLLYIPVPYSTKWLDDDIQEFVKKIFE